MHALAAGSEHVLALLDGGDEEPQVWGWGWNEHGNLGLAAGEGDVQTEREGEEERGLVVPADVRSPRRVWPPDEDDAGASDEQRRVRGRPVRVWAGMASSWILFEEEGAAA